MCKLALHEQIVPPKFVDIGADLVFGEGGSEVMCRAAGHGHFSLVVCVVNSNGRLRQTPWLVFDPLESLGTRLMWTIRRHLSFPSH